MTMKQLIRLVSGAIAPVLFLTSCGSPPGMTLLDTPLTNGRQAQRSDLGSIKQAPALDPLSDPFNGALKLLTSKANS